MFADSRQVVKTTCGTENVLTINLHQAKAVDNLQQTCYHIKPEQAMRTHPNID